MQKKETRMKVMDAAFNQDYVGQAPVIIAVCTTNIDYRMPNGQPSYPRRPRVRRFPHRPAGRA